MVISVKTLVIPATKYSVAKSTHVPWMDVSQEALTGTHWKIATRLYAKV